MVGLLLSPQSLLMKMRDSILKGDDATLNNLKLTLKSGVNQKDVLMEIVSIWREIALSYKVGKMSKNEEMEVMKSISNSLVPTIRVLLFLDKNIAEKTNPLGSVVVACMKGDGHTLMKDTMAMLLKTSGYKVSYKIGREDTPDSVISSIKTSNAKALLISTMQPTTFPLIRETIEALKREGLREKVLVVLGGGAATEEISRKLHCDIYDDDPMKIIEIVEGFFKSQEKENIQ